MNIDIPITINGRIEKDGDGFRGWCPSLPGLHVDGSTEEETARHLKDGAKAYFPTTDWHRYNQRRRDLMNELPGARRWLDQVAPVDFMVPDTEETVIKWREIQSRRFTSIRITSGAYVEILPDRIGLVMRSDYPRQFVSADGSRRAHEPQDYTDPSVIEDAAIAWLETRARRIDYRAGVSQHDRANFD